MVKSVVRLPPEEREQLLALVTTGRAAAVKLLHARLLRKADVGVDSRPWTAAEMADAWDTRASTVHRVRQAFVEQGVDAALSRKRPTGRPYRNLAGTQAAHLLAVACSAPPEGRVRWTLTRLADKLVAWDIVDPISTECVRTTLKKMCATPGSSSPG
jgi:Homeodomain-like domain